MLPELRMLPPLGHFKSLRDNMWVFAMIAAMALVSGCATTKTPVPVYGVEGQMRLLTGAWYGEYESVESGRQGSIYFMLEADADSAFGYVVMQPQSWEEQAFFDDVSAFANASERLAIRFVSIGAGRVVGRLAAYKDPVCGCLLETIFEGHLEEGIIEGIYASHGDIFHVSTSGRWWVKRKPSVSETMNP